jgi:helix-turn-helix protein
MHSDKPKLNTAEAAEYIGVTKGTLEVWRCNRVKHQPPYFKLGRKVVYSRELLDEYLNSRRN